MAVRSIVIIQKKATEPAKLNIKNVIGPASISLGAMIGTGAIIGVLGALSKLSANGQANRSYGYMGFNRFINNASSFLLRNIKL